MQFLYGLRSLWAAMSERQRLFLHLVVIIIAGALVYSNTLHVPFIMDDENIASIGAKDVLDIILHGGSRRVADVTFALNYRLHGLQVTGYHLINLVIHISVSITLYLFVNSVLAALRQSFPPPAPAKPETVLVDRFVPLVVALFFVVHPVQTQAVTYTIQRYTSLASLLYLMSIVFFIKGRLIYEKSNLNGYSWFLWGLSLTAGVLAVGSKEIAVTLPMMLFVVEIFLFRGRLINRKFLILGGVLCILCLAAGMYIWRDASLADFLYDLHHLTSEDPQLSRTTYFLTQTRVVVMYLGFLFLPIDQSLIHDLPLYTSPLSVPVIASLVLHLTLIAVAAYFYNKSEQNFKSHHDRGKAVLQRLVSFGIIWFYIAMSVESSIFPIMDIAFEHRMYLPSVGFFMSIVAGASLALNGRQTSWKVVMIPIAIIVIVLSAATLARNRVWNDALTLYEDTAKKAPNSVLALANLGDEYLLRNMPEKAIPCFVKAFELKPNLDAYTAVYLGEALQRLDVFSARFTTGKEYVLPGGGVSDYRFAGVVFNNLGLAYEYLGDREKAEKSYSKSLRIHPVYDLAWYNLGLLSISLGNKQQTARALVELQHINPSLEKALVAASQGKP